jgi:hypothetical protein
MDIKFNIKSYFGCQFDIKLGLALFHHDNSGKSPPNLSPDLSVDTHPYHNSQSYTNSMLRILAVRLSIKPSQMIIPLLSGNINPQKQTFTSTARKRERRGFHIPKNCTVPRSTLSSLMYCCKKDSQVV